jgi:peptidoglycan/xylan/chitin deacetylase (PgdA/CDA1 family)
VTGGDGRRSRLERACRLLRLIGIPLAVRHVLQRNRVTILFYHRPAPETFAAHVEALRTAYNLISLDAFVTALQDSTVKRLPPRSLVLTFDDGHRANAALLETFRALPARPTVFLCSGLLDSGEPFWFDVVADPERLKRMPDDERMASVATEARPDPAAAGGSLAVPEIERLKPYVDFQSHTVSHPILPRCSDEKAAREIAESREELERRLGRPVYALAYPNGDHSERDVRLAREAGYRCAVTVAPGFNGPRSDPFRLRRIAVDDDRDGPSVVLLKACGVWHAVKALRRAAPRAGGERAAPR